MTALARIGVALACFTAAVSHAEQAKTFAVEVRSQVGRAVAPYFTADLPEVQAEFTSARGMIASAYYVIDSARRLTIRIPTAPSTVRQPAGSYVDDNVFGNPELGYEQRLSLPFSGEAWAWGAVGVPLAGLGSTKNQPITRSQVLELSSALDGWRNTELFADGVVPMTAGARVRIAGEPWFGSLTMKLPLLFRISDGDHPSGARTRAIGFMPHVAVESGFRPTSWLSVATGLFGVAVLLPPVEPGRDGFRDGSFQLGTTTNVAAHLFDRLIVEAELIAAVGGPLRETLALALNLRYDH